MTQPLLSIAECSRRFGMVTAVDRLTFSVNRSEIFGFLGPNGAGKTTTMRMITGILPPDSGAIVIDGIHCAENSLAARAKIGYLPEANPLYDELTVREYLVYAGQLRNLSKGSLKSSMARLIDRCGLGDVIDREIAVLSKGYRQRVGIAQALLGDPALVILDEPMTGLDPNQIIQIRALIREIGRDKSIIYCSHILSEIETTCDRVLILSKGRMVAEGTPTELITQSQASVRFRVSLKADTEISHTSFESLGSLSDILHENERTSFIVTPFAPISGETIFNHAMQHHLTLSEITPISSSLESVFTQLTQGDQP